MIQAQKQGLVRVRELLAPTPDSPLHAAIHATEELGKYPALFKIMHEHGRAPRIVWPEARNVPHWEADKYATELGPFDWRYPVDHSQEGPGSWLGESEYWIWRVGLGNTVVELGFKLKKCRACNSYREHPCDPE